MKSLHKPLLQGDAGNELRSTVIEDAVLQAAMQPWVEMECYQLGSGRQITQMDSLDLGSQQIVRERQMVGVQKLGITPSDLCTISYCTPDPTFRFSELCASHADTIFFMPEHTEFDIYVPAGAQTGYVSFSQEEFLNGARALNPTEWEHTPQQLISISTTQQAELKGSLNLWLEWAEKVVASGAPLDIDLMRGMLLQDVLLITTAASQDGSRSLPMERSRAFHICRRARAFVEESLAADILPTIAEICTKVGASERTLLNAFRTYVGMSPLAYLRLWRLNRVRQTLLASDPQNTTVTAVAMRFGFLHLGRFSLDYKRVFDEPPSITLAT